MAQPTSKESFMFNNLGKEDGRIKKIAYSFADIASFANIWQLISFI